MLPPRRPAPLVAATTGLSVLLILIALTLYVCEGSGSSDTAGVRTALTPATRSAIPTTAPTARIAPTIIGLKLTEDPEAPARAAFPVKDRLFACFAAEGGTDRGNLTLVATAEGISAPPADGSGIVARSLPVAQSPDHACYRIEVERPPLRPGAYQVMVILGNAVLARGPFTALPPAVAATETPPATRAVIPATIRPPAPAATAIAPPRPTTAPPSPPPALTQEPTAIATNPPALDPTATPTPRPAPPALAPPPPTMTATPVRTIPPPALDSPTPRPPPMPPAPTVRPSGTPTG